MGVTITNREILINVVINLAYSLSTSGLVQENMGLGRRRFRDFELFILSLCTLCCCGLDLSHELCSCIVYKFDCSMWESNVHVFNAFTVRPRLPSR